MSAVGERNDYGLTAWDRYRILTSYRTIAMVGLSTNYYNASSFAAIYLVWGSTFLAIRWAVETIPPFTMMAMRCLLGGAILLALARLSGAATRWPTASEWLASAGGYDIGPFKEIDNAPIFASDPKLKAFHDVAYDSSGKPIGYWPGWPAPPSKKTSQSQAQYITADMFAKVLDGNDVTAAIKEAEDRLKNIWEKP